MTVKDVQARYDADATAYEKWWAPVLRPAMEPVLDTIDWSGVSTALEVGCGTGGVLDAITARAPRATAIGIDVTMAMLRLVPGSPALLQADAQRLPLQDATVDVAVSGFMLQHVDEPGLALREMGRVVRPGGQLAVAAWGAEPEQWAADLIFSEELDAVGAPDFPTVRPGRAATATPDRLIALAAAAGFDDCSVENDALDWRPTPDHVFGQLSTMRVTGRRFAALTPDQARTAGARIRQRLDETVCTLPSPYEVLILSGKRVNLRHN